MGKRITLPGSEGEESGAFRGGGAGGFSETERAALGELVRWWSHRRAMDDSADPLETAFGGVDGAALVRTAGLVPARAFFPKPLLIAAGASFLVHALGVPANAAAAGDVYSIFGLCHFYRDPAAGVMARATTIGRAPASATSLEVIAALTDPPDGAPAILVAGVAGLTIDWKVEVYRLER